MRKVIGFISIGLGLFMILNIYSNIQALYFSDISLQKNFPKINLSKQIYFYFELFLIGILGVFSGINFIKNKKTGWILSCTFWIVFTCQEIYTIIINLKKFNLLYSLPALFCVSMLAFIISKDFKNHFNIKKNDWQKALIYAIILLLIKTIY